MRAAVERSKLEAEASRLRHTQRRHTCARKKETKGDVNTNTQCVAIIKTDCPASFQAALHQGGQRQAPITTVSLDSRVLLLDEVALVNDINTCVVSVTGCLVFVFYDTDVSLGGVLS